MQDASELEEYLQLKYLEFKSKRDAMAAAPSTRQLLYHVIAAKHRSMRAHRTPDG
jgi:hypothetical protein